MKSNKLSKKVLRGSQEVSWNVFIVGIAAIVNWILVVGMVADAISFSEAALIASLISFPLPMALGLLYFAYLCDFHPS